MTYLHRVDTFMLALDAETYRVGGAVRDELLRRRCKDADYMVRGMTLSELRDGLRGLGPDSLTPLKLRDGRQVGWRVAKKGLGLIEISLPRAERSTGPGRHDFEIVADGSITLDEDCKRRDFTFNALYKRIHLAGVLDGGMMPRPIGVDILDPTGRGLYDLQHRLIHTTHESSFADDPLRTLRALRFVSTLGYDLAVDTDAQMREHAHAVTGLTRKGVSGTAFDELCKLLMGDDVAKALRIARDTGVLAVLLPELEPMLGFDQGSKYHDLTVDEHTFKALETAAHVDAPLRVRLALLFHDAGKPDSAWCGTDGHKHYYAYTGPDPDASEDQRKGHEAVGERLWRSACQRLNVPKGLRSDVATLIREHMVQISRSRGAVQVRRLRVRLGDDILRDLLMHRMCDATGTATTPKKEQLARMAEAEMLRKEAVKMKVPASVRDLTVDGKDAIDAGLAGTKIGAALRAVLDEVVVDPSDQKRSRAWQLSRLR